MSESDVARRVLDDAARRDAIAAARDAAARVSDAAQDARDTAITERDAVRAVAAERALAAADRKRAARDREQAARDRLLALQDRDVLAQQLALTETDALTGARSRAAGLADLDREIDRCNRAGGLLVVAYVDVVGLKAINDNVGHHAGDELLKTVVTQIRTQIRSYDLIVRLGGDEFLCVMSHMTLGDVHHRFRQIGNALGSAERPAAIRAGFAQFQEGQSADELIACADQQLLTVRRPTTPEPPP